MHMRAGDPQLSVRINMNKAGELVTNGRRRVYFWESQLPAAPTFKYYSPPLRAKDFRQPIGDFIASTFVPETVQALTSTSDGDVVVWDEQGLAATPGTAPTDRRASKVMRLHATAIHVLTAVGAYVVTGAADGCVRLYDPMLRIVAWFEDAAAGGIRAVSFARAVPPELAPVNTLSLPDFAIATDSGKVVALRTSCFEDALPDQRRGELLLDSTPTDVVDMAAHPSWPELAVLTAGGLLERWDYATHARLASKQLGEAGGAVVTYARDGALLFAGSAAGHVHILDARTMAGVYESRHTANRITAIAASPSGKHVALADSAHQVLIYAYLPFKGDNYRWDFLGKIVAHHSRVVSLSFGQSPSGAVRLFSTDDMGFVADYDLANSSLSEGVQLLGHTQVPGALEAVASAACFAPPMPYFASSASQTLLLVADDMFKLRLFDADEKQCCATFLGPVFGAPVTRLLVFRCVGAGDRSLVAFSIGARVVGLLDWPLSGHPDAQMGVIAHPGAIIAMTVSFDGRQLFTAGADGVINAWAVSPEALVPPAAREAAAPPPEQGGLWAGVIDDPAALAEMKDFFYYAQLMAQGEDELGPRRVTGRVPVTALANLFRALGDYPSQARSIAASPPAAPQRPPPTASGLPEPPHSPPRPPNPDTLTPRQTLQP